MAWRMAVNVAAAGAYVIWADQRSWLGALTGLVAGFVLIAVYDLTTRRFNYPRRLTRLVRFSVYFLGILVRANLQIAWEILTPGFKQTPLILRYPVSHLDESQITVLANAITLTPGPLVVDVAADGSVLYVHCMYAENREDAIAGLRGLDERLQREVFS